MILCADDYGQNLAISTGICELVAAKRLTAVSCLTTSKTWITAAALLKPYQGQVDIGLHFNLTYGKLITCSSRKHSQLLLNCLLHRMKIEDVIRELWSQIDSFVAAMGCNPDFIDGHQHIQHLPVVREAIIEVYSQRFKINKPYLRLAGVTQLARLLQRPNKLKQVIIHLTGAKKLQLLCQKYNIPHNIDFMGIYDFSLKRNYGQMFKTFLKTITGPALTMCHPGHFSDEPEDAINSIRPKEWDYFNSDQFLEDLMQANVRLSRFQDLT